MKVAVSAIAVSLLLSGCTHIGSSNKYQPYPQAQLPERATQGKIQAAQHWDALARNEAQLISKTLSSGAILAFGGDISSSSFAKAYRKMLTQHLLENGMRISDEVSTAQYVIDYETQIIQHRDRDTLRPPAGSISGVGASAWLIAHAAQNWGDPGLVAIPFAIAGDMYLANNRDAATPNTEVLMTTNLRSGSMVVQSSTRIYYFNPGDGALYSTASDSRKIVVTDQP